MFVNFISNQHCNKLRNPGKYQIGVQSFFVLGFTPCNAKAVLEVVDGFLHIYTYFIGGIPFLCTTDCSGICTKILLWIYVNHPSTGRCCAGIITMAYTSGFPFHVVPLPFHFGTDKFHGGKSTSQV